MGLLPRPRPWMLVATVWIAPAALATIAAVLERRLHGEKPASARELIFAGGDWLVYAVLTPIIFGLSRRWPIARPRIAARALLHFLFALLFCVGWATAGTLLKLALGRIFEPERVRAFIAEAGDQFWWLLIQDWLSWILTTLPFGVIVYLCLTGIAHAIQYFVEAGRREVALARLSAQLSDARLAALRAQVNPHFLFNSLNTIAVLVRDGSRETATRVLEQLSDVLRITLDRSDANEVSLEEELGLVRQYLAVEEARFSDRLRPEFHVDPALLSAAIPAFALQLLVENAVRHGIAKRIEAGRVAITARRDGDILEIVVEDDGAGIAPEAAVGEAPAAAAPPADARAHGLANLRERLHTLHGDRASLVVRPAPIHGTIATLRVPYREILLEPRDDAQQ